MALARDEWGPGSRLWWPKGGMAADGFALTDTELAQAYRRWRRSEHRDLHWGLIVAMFEVRPAMGDHPYHRLADRAQQRARKAGWLEHRRGIGGGWFDTDRALQDDDPAPRDAAE